MTTDTHDALWLDAGQQHAWRAYLVGTTLLMDRLDRDLRERHHLSLPEYEILVRLSEAPERRLRMAALADSLSHSRSRVTHTVARMERAGLVSAGRLRVRRPGRGSPRSPPTGSACSKRPPTRTSAASETTWWTSPATTTSRRSAACSTQ